MKSSLYQIKPEEVRADLQLLEQLALRSANSAQHEGLYSTFGTVSRHPALRRLLGYLFSDESELKATGDVSTREVMLQLERLAVNDHPIDQDKKTGWWNGLDTFVMNLEEVSRHADEVGARLLKVAYQNEGENADLVGVQNLARLATEVSPKMNHSYFVLTGKSAETPYCAQVPKILDHLERRLKGGLRSRRFRSAFERIATLESHNVPEDLWNSARLATAREWRSGLIDSWIPRPEDISRYLQAGKAEREYLRAVIETPRFWGPKNNFFIRFVDAGIINPRMYQLLTTQIRKGASSEEVRNSGKVLKDLEQNPEAAKILGEILTGRRVGLDNLLAHLESRPVVFTGGEGGEYSSIAEVLTPLPRLINVAEKRPSARLRRYLHSALTTGADAQSIADIAQGFPSEWDGKNTGARAQYSRSCFGERFEENKKRHKVRTPNSSSSDVIERGAAALKVLYDTSSGLKHEVAIGRLNLEERECYTAAFVNQGGKRLHLVFPNSMMFDPQVGEENCNNCDRLSLCRGMEEYSSAVLFNPKEFNPDFLAQLQETVPGAFELHRGKRGVHHPGNFALFPERMSPVYFNQFVSSKQTPVNTGRPFSTMVLFPFNLQGSAYLARSLDSGEITLPYSNWPRPEEVHVSKEQWEDKSLFPEIQLRLAPFVGREITIRGLNRPVIYHPSLSEFDFKDKFTGGANANYICRNAPDITIEPVYQRAIFAPGRK